MKTNYIFKILDKSKIGATLPMLFDILYENMKKIAPFEKSYQEVKAEWLGQVAPAMKKEKRQIILMFDNDVLAGYTQYYINETTFMIEEIQLKYEYQRTMLLYEFCKFMKAIVPSKTTYIEAYADKRNIMSQKLMQKIGMKIISDDEKYYHFQGALEHLKFR